jgi:ATP-binding cassette, subfamily B, bacterial
MPDDRSQKTRLPIAASTFKWLGVFVRPHKRRLAGVLCLSLLSTSLALAQPYITKLLIDRGLLARRMDIVVLLCGVMLAVAVVAMLLSGANRLLYTDVSARILFAMREAVYRHLLTLAPTFYSRMSGGDLMARLDGDVSEIQRFCVDSVLAGVNGVVALAVTLVLLVSLNWQLSLLALLLLPAEMLFLRAMRPRVEEKTRRLRERASELASFFFETLPAVKFVQSVGAEDRELGRLRGLNNAYRRDLLGLQIVNFATGAGPNLMTSLSGVVVFVVGGYYVVGGRFTLGSLIAFSAYLGRATGPVQTLLGLYVATRRAQVSVARVMELTRAEPAVTAAVRPIRLPKEARGEIRIDGVTFGYGDGTAPVLCGADMFIPAGRKVGVVGPSGVGKTTLIDLLQRHYDPSAGRILLDGVDLRELDLAELRRRVTVVAQDTAIFSGSVMENIRYAAPDADDAAVRRAAERAGIDEFVRSLPRGYDTEVGPRGIRLSGGQRQRLAIARALLQDPLVLVLDEATSAIDLETEARISDEIDCLFPDRTRLVVTHRPQTLRNAQMVCQLVEGQLSIERAINGVGS